MLLRPGLLDGTTVLAAPATALTEACAAAGATVATLDAPLLDEPAVEAATQPCHALVVDGAPLFAEHGLARALDATWCAVRATVNAAFIAPQTGGKIVLVAPRPAADDPHVEGLRAGYENLARTTSVEWARFQIRPTAILPGPQATDDELADLVAYLVSPAGDYYAGCRFDLQ
jgi:hypothetical protein